MKPNKVEKYKNPHIKEDCDCESCRWYKKGIKDGKSSTQKEIDMLLNHEKFLQEQSEGLCREITELRNQLSSKDEEIKFYKLDISNLTRNNLDLHKELSEAKQYIQKGDEKADEFFTEGYMSGREYERERILKIIDDGINGFLSLAKKLRFKDADNNVTILKLQELKSQINGDKKNGN